MAWRHHLRHRERQDSPRLSQAERSQFHDPHGLPRRLHLQIADLDARETLVGVLDRSEGRGKTLLKRGADGHARRSDASRPASSTS
jgi:hypothetical protein